MILITGSYNEVDARRRSELLECLKRNAQNERLLEIHLFLEDPVEPEGMTALASLHPNKIRIVPHGQRVTFQILFAYANRNLTGHRVVIANADIYFDQSLTLLDGYDLSGQLVCLSRWDVQPDGSAQFFDQPASHDAWIFQSPIPEFPCDFHLGLLGCDGRLAWEAADSGLKTFNPSRSLRANHLHLSQVRRYKWEWLAGPKTSVPAVYLGTSHPSALGKAPDAPCASVAFSETMGYDVAQLKPGASSHKNDARPFVLIPEMLAGLQFTQVVTWIVSPVEVEFLTSGKLYVLVGNDWEGFHPATAWLYQTGFKESVPVVQTKRGSGFEVWSLVGEVGQHYVLPTQVMLVADHLIRR
jgi:hypothetical protein